MNCNMKPLIVAVGLVLSLMTIEATAQSTGYTQWSPPANLGPIVNSPYLDACVTVSKNHLSLFFRSNRPVGGITLSRLWVAKRAKPDEPWGTPQVVPNFNDGIGFSCPALSPDEHRMFFVTNRSESSCGSGDLWVSRRHHRRDDFGWESPVNLGCESAGFVNTSSGESTPAIFEDETGTEVLYFSGAGGIRQSRMRPDGTFGPSVLVTELLPGSAPAVRRDGLEVIFMSGRAGGPYYPASSMWTSTRASTNQPWSTPVPLAVLSSGASEGGRMCFSFDGRSFYFFSARPGGVSPAPELIPPPAWAYWDLYVAEREKLRY